MVTDMASGDLQIRRETPKSDAGDERDHGSLHGVLGHDEGYGFHAAD
jgi:hypothetical protein